MSAPTNSGRAPTTARDRQPPTGGRLVRLRERWRPGAWNGDATALTVVTVVLLLTGLVMSYSASIVDAAEAGDPFGVFRRQLVWAALGVPAFVVTANLDHRIWRRLAWPLMAASLIGLLLVLVPGVGVTRFGSTRWLGFGPMVVQPSEVAKLAALLWIADVLERKRPRDGSLHTTAHLNVPAIPMLVLLAVLVLLQPDLGTTILLGLIVGAVLWVEGLPGKYVAVGAFLGLVSIAVLAVVAPYRLRRITGWLDPEADPLGTGYQLMQSLFALGEGGWFGVGLGSSRSKWNFVPNPETDFIFAIIGEELGLLGATLVLGLFAALLYFGLRAAYGAEEGFARTVAFGITAWIVGQALINIGTVTGLLPITGVTLPLVSVGGSSLVSTLVALGILVSIARSTPPVVTRLRPHTTTPRLIHRSGDAS
ncbi:putative lipid II flippase FtsW [Egicoccus sp. AB-alg6-2]|uniref:putative lipid II flippase FtsW n=1 Tax=Egicoccus sp. AB-alg6-2 TaxID=3242692 RepID=UPI00359CE9A1